MMGTLKQWEDIMANQSDDKTPATARGVTRREALATIGAAGAGVAATGFAARLDNNEDQEIRAQVRDRVAKVLENRIALGETLTPGDIIDIYESQVKVGKKNRADSNTPPGIL